MGPQIVDNPTVFICERILGTRVCQATICIESDHVTYRFSHYEATTQWELHLQELDFVRKFKLN